MFRGGFGREGFGKQGCPGLWIHGAVIESRVLIVTGSEKGIEVLLFD